MRKIVKLILGLILAVLMLFVITGCNAQLIDTNYKFDTVHIYETGKCYKIKTWRDYDNSDQLQVTLEDGTVLLLHSADCALVHGDCVLCKEHK